MQRPFRRLLAAAGVIGAVVLTAPSAVAASSDAPTADVLATTRPAFKMPFLCQQMWRGSNWNGHSPAHSIDWNHYSVATGAPDDRGRKVLASAGGTVLSSYYSKSTGYGNTIVIGHGNGWRTRYAHLMERDVHKGDKVTTGKIIGKVGATSALYDITPHLHYEQIHNGSVVVSVVQGVTWSDFLARNQVSKNSC